MSTQVVDASQERATVFALAHELVRRYEQLGVTYRKDKATLEDMYRSIGQLRHRTLHTPSSLREEGMPRGGLPGYWYQGRAEVYNRITNEGFRLAEQIMGKLAVPEGLSIDLSLHSNGTNFEGQFLTAEIRGKRTTYRFSVEYPTTIELEHPVPGFRGLLGSTKRETIPLTS